MIGLPTYLLFGKSASVAHHALCALRIYHLPIIVLSLLLLHTMRFPPATKAAFFTAITSILHSPSTAFSTTARQSYSSTARRDFQRQVVARRPSSTCASADSLLSVRSALAANSRRYNHPLSVRGGSTTSLSSTAMTETAAPKEIYRKDYKPLAYKVSNVAMNFDIRDGKTVVERLEKLVYDALFLIACTFC